MGIIPYIVELAKPLGAFFVGLIGFLLIRKNQKLKQETKEQKAILEDQQKILEIQNKVLDVTQNTKPTDFDGTLERMRSNKL